MNSRTCIAILLATGLHPLHAQKPAQVSLPAPAPAGTTVVLGFLGFADRWDDPQRGVRMVALRLRKQGMTAETFSHQNLHTAKTALLRALDTNRNGMIDPDEALRARVIIYGQSLGGNATVKLAKYLEKKHIPVLLTVQIDSVGLHDNRIPPNVHAAANLYQTERLSIRGQPRIRAANPTRTKILGNFEYHYPLWLELLGPERSARRIFGGGHARMESDPRVWSRVESIILEAAGCQ